MLSKEEEIGRLKAAAAAEQNDVFQRARQLVATESCFTEALSAARASAIEGARDEWERTAAHGKFEGFEDWLFSQYAMRAKSVDEAKE